MIDVRPLLVLVRSKRAIGKRLVAKLALIACDLTASTSASEVATLAHESGWRVLLIRAAWPAAMRWLCKHHAILHSLAKTESCTVFLLCGTSEHAHQTESGFNAYAEIPKRNIRALQDFGELSDEHKSIVEGLLRILRKCGRSI